MSHPQSDWRVGLQNRLQLLCDADGAVKKEIAMQLIRKSAWWLTHVSGPVRAPRHADRISGTPPNWSIEFGANTFKISVAVRRCCQTISAWTSDKQTAISPNDWVILRRKLMEVVRGSVENYRGDEYGSYGNSEEMTFGAQAINLSDFVKVLGQKLNLIDLDIHRRANVVSSVTDRKGKIPLVKCPLCDTPIKKCHLSRHQKERCPNRIISTKL